MSIPVLWVWMVILVLGVSSFTTNGSVSSLSEDYHHAEHNRHHSHGMSHHQSKQLEDLLDRGINNLRRRLSNSIGFGDHGVHSYAHLGQFITKINVTLDEVVDANLEQMSHVTHVGNLCPFKRAVIDKMLKNQKIKIMVVGGSVTYGSDLRDRMKQRWTTPFNDIMNSGWYPGGFDIVNMGTPACNVDTWIYRVREFSTADFIIIDLSVNDQGFDLQALPHLYHTFIQLLDDLPNHPAMMVHQAFRSGMRDPREIQGHCPAVGASISCCDGTIKLCRKWYDMADFVGITLQKLRVPFVSYRDLVWPDYFHPPKNLDQFWNGLSHPDYKAHQLFAKLLSFAFMQQIKEAHKVNSEHCHDKQLDRYVESQHRDNSVLPICGNPLTLMVARTDDIQSRDTFHIVNTKAAAQPTTDGTTTMFPLVTSNEWNHWRFYNDSRQKYGWILNMDKAEQDRICSTPGATTSGEGIAKGSCQEMIKETTISLEIETGNKPTVQINFLRSYTGDMGIAKVWFDNNEKDAIMLNSQWGVDYSVTHTVTISSEPMTEVSTLLKGDSYVIPSLAPESGNDKKNSHKHILNIAMASTEFVAGKKEKYKWKLLGVTGC